MSEVVKAMQGLGVQRPFLPPDADTSDFDEAATVTTEEEPEVVTQPARKPAQQQAQAHEEPEEEHEPEQNEKQRRTWQSSYAKAQAELEATKQRMQLLEQQNQMLASMFQGFAAQPQMAQQPQAPKEDKEPKLTDFIAREEYSREEAFDPDTKSGAAHQRYLEARARWAARQEHKSLMAQQQETAARDLTQRQIAALAAEYPEFRDPFGRPNMAAITAWIEDLSKKDFVTLKKMMDGTNGAAKAAPPQSAEAAIGKRANKPSSVATSPGASKESQNVPPGIAILQKMYGGNLYIPPGAEIA